MKRKILVEEENEAKDGKKREGRKDGSVRGAYQERRIMIERK